MEYEIGDDPQGLPDFSEGLRDGGINEELVFTRLRPSIGRPPQLDEDHEEALLIQQLGEVA
jgi:hypothetical protein